MDSRAIEGDSVNGATIKQCIGYVCATVIVVALLWKDGDVALAAATGAVLVMTGAQTVTNAIMKKKA